MEPHMQAVRQRQAKLSTYGTKRWRYKLQGAVMCGPKMKLLNITLGYKVIKIQENAPQPQWSGRVDVRLSGRLEKKVKTSTVLVNLSFFCSCIGDKVT